MFALFLPHISLCNPHACGCRPTGLVSLMATVKRSLSDDGGFEPPQKRVNPTPPPEQAYAAVGAAGPIPASIPPPQPRPTQYRLTHTPLPSGGAPFRQLKVEDALAYLDQVRSAASWSPPLASKVEMFCMPLCDCRVLGGPRAPVRSAPSSRDLEGSNNCPLAPQFSGGQRSVLPVCTCVR